MHDFENCQEKILGFGNLGFLNFEKNTWFWKLSKKIFGFGN